MLIEPSIITSMPGFDFLIRRHNVPGRAPGAIPIQKSSGRLGRCACAVSLHRRGRKSEVKSEDSRMLEMGTSGLVAGLGNGAEPWRQRSRLASILQNGSTPSRTMIFAAQSSDQEPKESRSTNHRKNQPQRRYVHDRNRTGAASTSPRGVCRSQTEFNFTVKLSTTRENGNTNYRDHGSGTFSDLAGTLDLCQRLAGNPQSNCGSGWPREFQGRGRGAGFQFGKGLAGIRFGRISVKSGSRAGGPNRTHHYRSAHRELCGGRAARREPE